MRGATGGQMIVVSVSTHLNNTSNSVRLSSPQRFTVTNPKMNIGVLCCRMEVQNIPVMDQLISTNSLL
jgi:hypothetical protein